MNEAMKLAKFADAKMVGALCQLAGLTLDARQQEMLCEVFGTQPDGTLLHPEFMVTQSSWEKQTDALAGCALGWLYLAGEQRILWTTERAVTSRRVFERVASIIRGSDLLLTRVARIRAASGDQEITLADGPRMLFRIRHRNFTRGYHVGRMIIDESQALTEMDRAELTAMLDSRRTAQVLYGSRA